MNKNIQIKNLSSIYTVIYACVMRDMLPLCFLMTVDRCFREISPKS